MSTGPDEPSPFAAPAPGQPYGQPASGLPASGPPGFVPPGYVPPGPGVQGYDVQGYGVQGYGVQGQPPFAQPQGTNTMAILSLVFAFLFWPLGIVFGFIARSQIKRTGEGGGGLALAGLIVSLVWLGLLVLIAVLAIVFASSAPGSGTQYGGLPVLLG